MTERKEFRDLADPDEAAEVIADLPIAPGVETVPLSEARGRVLAERIGAGIDVPGFDRSSLDGYAVRARDTFGADEAEPAELAVVGAVHAGEEPAVSVGEGEAVEISTGAVMPEGADAMVPIERIDERGAGDAIEAVLVRTSVAPGDNVMFAGADVAAGERALGPGTRLTPREIGLLSALGVDEVPVRARPTVGIVSTGDELVRPGADLEHRRGEIHDVNSYAIAAAVEDAGGEPRVYPHVGDDLDELERQLHAAAEECDLVCSSGSTSASAVDVVYRVIEERGDLLLHGVALKPGKPTLVGTLGGSAYVGLPGYPVSAMMVFRTLVAPAIRSAAGIEAPERATLSGRMATEARFEEGRRRLMPVGLVEPGPGETVSEDDDVGDGSGTPASGLDTSGTAHPNDNWLVYPVDKGSGATTSLADADGIVTVDADVAYVGEGERVEVELFSADARPPALFGVGEDDPALSRLLDRVSRPRYLGVGTRQGLRRLRNGVPDVAVAAGPTDRDVDASEIGTWSREWGLVVAEDNPEGIDGLTDLVDRDLRLVNRTTDSGLRTSLGNAVAEFADERGVDRHEVVDAIDGFDLGLRAHESPARAVLAGDADAGLGLRATAGDLGLGFVTLGDQRVRVLANPDRIGKAGVADLQTALDDLAAIAADLPGYDPE